MGKEANEATEGVSKGYKKTGGSKKGQVKLETLPSSHGIRIEPRIDNELKEKAAKAVRAKERKANKGEGKKKKKGEDEDEFDEMTSDKKLKRKSAGSPKKGKGRNPWTDSEDDGDVSDGNLSDILDDAPVIPREKAAGSRRAAANIKFDKYNSDESEEEEGSDEEMFDNSGIAEAK